MPPFWNELKDRFREPTQGSSACAAGLTLAVVFLSGLLHLGALIP